MKTPAQSIDPVTSPATGTSESNTSGNPERVNLPWARAEGLPFPLGVSWIEAQQAYNFALYSKHADRVTLLLYAEGSLDTPAHTLHLDPLHNKTGRIWHCRVAAPMLKGAKYYAYSVAGPPPAGLFEWHSFDADKILTDPYARALHFPTSFAPEAARQPGSNEGRAPLGLIHIVEPSPWRVDDPQPFHESDAILYELHVRGFTRSATSGVSDASRGTYAGIIDKIPYLTDLGITAVELMPVFQGDPGNSECWGYMPLNFFAPECRYARSADPARHALEFRTMVHALNKAGIEVILDAVYNHTAEGNHLGPSYSYKGIDNSTYYLMNGTRSHPYLDLSGTGNTLNCANRAVRRMIVDSMRFWVKEMHVDGFRFDLASVFARDADGSLRWDDPPIFGEIASDPDFSTIRLIAEPWDASGLSALGRGFPGISWHQWNALFRDDVRRFVRGDEGMVTSLMRRLYGSDDLFPDDRLHACRPWQSINYVTCHDGFTLYDLLAYNHKRNWANGHDNNDGPAENFSWNCGWEGDQDVPAEVSALRKQQAKNFAILLLLANGTPMIRAGDEFLQTQGGNDNPYNQDNPTSWLDWNRLEANRDVHRFFRLAIQFRKAHPSLCRSSFWRDDVRWYGQGERPALSAPSHCLAFCVRGASQRDDDIYVLINASAGPLDFQIQEGGAHEWHRVVDTSLSTPDDFREPGHEPVLALQTYSVAPRSVVVLARKA
jgi:glycogen operon protein